MKVTIEIDCFSNTGDGMTVCIDRPEYTTETSSNELAWCLYYAALATGQKAGHLAMAFQGVAHEVLNGE